jgi:hypothetical protein
MTYKEVRMGRHARNLMVVGLVLVAAGVAAANGLLATPPSTGTPAARTMLAQASSTTTPTAVNPTTGGVAPTTGGATGTATSQGSGTSATTPTTSTLAAATPTETTIEQVVSVTRAVDAGTAALSVFTVPGGRLLVVTDVLITNPSPSPACGASISPGGASGTATASPGTTASTAGVVVAPTAVESGTGLLCIPSQTTLSLGLTTGMEFTAGQSVVLRNTTLPATSATLTFHLRGFLVSTSS